MSQKPHEQISPNFLYILLVAMVWSSFSDSAIHYILPVLWMMSCFYTIERMSQKSKTMLIFRPVHQVAALGVKSAVTGCILLSVVLISNSNALIITINLANAVIIKQNGTEKYFKLLVV